MWAAGDFPPGWAGDPQRLRGGSRGMLNAAHQPCTSTLSMVHNTVLEGKLCLRSSSFASLPHQDFPLVKQVPGTRRPSRAGAAADITLTAQSRQL